MMMMGVENQGFDESHLYASKEEMKNLVLDDHPVNGSAAAAAAAAAATTTTTTTTITKSYANFQSAISYLSDAHHPLSHPSLASPVDSDPLLAPPPYPELRTPTTSDDNSYIEPPPYVDVVIFSPGEINGIESPSPGVSQTSMSFSRSSSLNADYIRITVSDPHKEQEMAKNSIVPGGNTYVTYLITTRANSPELGATEFSVRRRFRDVVTLGDRLAESYRGFFIPPRPDKSVVEGRVMQKQEFVEQRRAALEKYLKRLAGHPVIRRSEELKVFLQVQQWRWLPLPTSTDVVQPEKGGGRDLLRLFKELKQSVVNDWGGSRPLIVEEDKEFLERKEKMHDLEQQLRNASQQAESLVKAQQDIGETMGDLGFAFIKLTKLETEEAVFNTQRARAADMKNFATAAVKASRYYRELNSHTVKHLVTLHEYLELMLAFHAALSDRASALLTVQTLITESSSLYSRSEKLEVGSSKVFGGDKSRIHKIEELKEATRLTEDAKNVAIREYERIKENNRTERERTDKERRVDLLNMLKGFVVNQVGYAEKIAHVWGKVAEETST